MTAGLRVDVDTFRGTRLGVPRLISILREHGVKATFYFSVGPDNMGRHLWRLFKPSFLRKMLRTRAPSLYGWDILRCGVVGQGPDIGRAYGDIIRAVEDDGHEVGLHAWDHQRWQSMDMSGKDEIVREVERGVSRFADILGHPPASSAAPAWRAPVAALAAKMSFPFSYNSDCRGSDCFLPTDGTAVYQPQIPVTLPTYDEMLGTDGVTDDNYNQRILEMFRPDGLNVLCIHAEAEGIAKAELFARFLSMAGEKGIAFSRLDAVLASRKAMQTAATQMRSIPGRSGEMCFQSERVRNDGRDA
ncbi:MAG: 4-deoxy-4-formamido-L-arabinose-phosphoundecaprenol deformylase [Planctomycetota bacterium]|jgi:undecaprenyl phosphate-alpha-L-ara4FN deformylase|nr:4-deoxy-4-formamido-L-arabinose-phosphoundecaprenol deformylase [Planctomycetota bacterium]